jgi:5-methyltetrahydropteroyltriglutamate--homocysteine methyltransferase
LIDMPIPTEPVGSIPRPRALVDAIAVGNLTGEALATLYDDAVRETIHLFEATGSPVITDGEQSKPSFATYPIHGLDILAPDGVTIAFADGHTRQLPKLNGSPFHYATFADAYLEKAKQYATVPVKQAVISASALSLLYPAEGIKGYAREEFLEDLVHEHELDLRRCLKAGAYNVQVDFTEGRLAVKLDPSKALLKSFVAVENMVLQRFSDQERMLLGVHTCPGGDRDSTHSADVDYAELLPDLFQMRVGNFYVQLASEKDRVRVLKVVKEHLRPGQRVFVGVVDPIDPKVETPEEVRDRVLEAAEIIPLEQLGTTDDCGFSPFGDDTSTARETAFAKIRARVEGTALAAEKLGV